MKYCIAGRPSLWRSVFVITFKALYNSRRFASLLTSIINQEQKIHFSSGGHFLLLNMSSWRNSHDWTGTSREFPSHGMGAIIPKYASHPLHSISASIESTTKWPLHYHKRCTMRCTRYVADHQHGNWGDAWLEPLCFVPQKSFSYNSVISEFFAHLLWMYQPFG